MPDKEMDALGREIIEWYAEWNPIYATYIGIHDYDHLLPDSSVETLQKELKLFKDYKARLKSLKTKDLSPDRRIDRDFLLHAIDLQLFDEEVFRRSECFPSAPSDFGTAIMLLFMRDFAPLPERLSNISSRFTAARKFFDDSKERLKKPVKLWVQIGAESCHRLQGLLTTIEGAAKNNLHPKDAEALYDTSAKASEAIKDQRKWLHETILPKSEERYGMGAKNFNQLLKLRHLGYSKTEIYNLGKKYLNTAKRELKALAKQIKPGASIEEVKEMVQQNRPRDFAEALTATAQAMEDGKRFTIEHDLLTVPTNETLKVTETPDYLRHVMPFAAYMPSARFEKMQQGIYTVTPVEKDSHELKKHSYPAIWNTAVHEAYPGHHLHNVCAHTNESKARAFIWAVETVEGWAHYCEDMMKEYGFHAEPETKFLQTYDTIWRACRILIDIDLHSGKMNFDQAVDMLVNEAGMDKVNAVAEVKRYTYNPGYQLSYLLGKHMILELKKHVKKKMRMKFNDKFFHDTLVYAGLLPMSLIREIFDYKMEELGIGSKKARK